MKDNTMPEGKWKFDDEVTNAFDDMLQRSVPQIDMMRQACFDLACRFCQKGTDIVDLGCSRGSAVSPLVNKYSTSNHFLGLEVSKPMLKSVRKRFDKFIKAGVVDIQEFDLRKGYPDCQASVTLAILTIQFVPIEYRQRIIRDVYRHTVEGGAFIFVEKILGANAEINQLMVDRYYALKSQSGYSQEAIERKRLSLEGVLVPVTAKWNEELLQMAGFRFVDCFWRWMNFAGWIAIK